MITISLCMIVKNEEDTLFKCLESVKDVMDEIVIVDTGSTDRTKETASKYTDKIYDFKWFDDFSAARNYSYRKANMDYIMWLDADDVMLPGDLSMFRELKNNLEPSVDIVMMKYNVGFDSQGNATFSYYRERLSKRSGNYLWHEPVHEYLDIGGKIIEADISITHQKIHDHASDRNLRVYEKILGEGRELTARGLYYYARELMDNRRYHDAIIYFNKFLDSGQGWIEDNIRACSDLAKCYTSENDNEKCLKALIRSLQYDTPRADICCQLGYYYKQSDDYKRALFWFKLATELNIPESNWGFIEKDYWGYIPCIEMCVCHDKLGNITEAIRCNNKAAEYKPDDPAVLYNRRYFEGLEKA